MHCPGRTGILRDPNVVPWRFWDSENNRLQDGRASYGMGFQFLFIGGLQLNWVWSKRLPFTQYTYENFGVCNNVALSQ